MGWVLIGSRCELAASPAIGIKFPGTGAILDMGIAL
jgi:hypothetical protein